MHEKLHMFCHFVCAELYPLFVRFPTGADARRSMKAFQNFCALPGVVGAIDGTHVEITRPAEWQELYYNKRIGCSSFNNQVVVDGRG